MDLGLKGKVALIAGASKGLGYAVAQALAAEGHRVSISSRDEAAIAERGDADRARDRRHRCWRCRWTSDRPDAIERWVRRPPSASAGSTRSMTNSGGPPAGAAVSFDDQAWQDAVGAAALQRAAHGPRGGAVHGGARRRRDPHVHVVVGQGTDPEPRALDRRARVGVRAGQDAGARARARQKIRVNQIIPGRIDTDRVRQLDEINAKKQGVSVDEAKAKVDGRDSARPLRRGGRVRTRRRVPALRRRRPT